MTLRELAYICAVARHEHFGKAAEACHVSQPTLSGQIRKLEAELGVAVFERTNKTVRLTTVGARIVALAEQVLTLNDQIEATAAAHRDPFAGPFRLGMLPTIAPGLVPVILERIWSRWPELSLFLGEALTDPLTEELVRGDLDAAVVATAPVPAGLEEIPLYDEPFFVVMPRDHALAKAPSLCTAEIDASELLLLTEGHCLRDQALSLCGSATEDPGGKGATTRATSLETILSLVCIGQGVTLIPALGLRAAWLAERGLVAVPLLDPEARRSVRLVYRGGYQRMPLVTALAGLIREAVEAVGC